MFTTHLFSVQSEPFDSDAAVRLRAAARVEVDGRAGRKTDVGAPLVTAMMAAHVIVRDHHDIAVGCGGLVSAGDGVYELRRVFVRSQSRGRGAGTMLLRELEAQAAELGAPAVVYETDAVMTEMIRFLEAAGYYRIAAWGVYVGNESSVCLAKTLR
jgi:GNAT superfamily N-acetyltransferase